jgi:aspartyl/glutamyl-tRNA(Asn/Gln) amidotransferase C subunit
MDKKTVSTIAYLSRLSLNEQNEEKITKDLENIIKFVDQLDAADT